MQIWFFISPFKGWVKISSASLKILIGWQAFQPGPNILLFFCVEAAVPTSLCRVSMKCGWKPFIARSHFTSQSLPKVSWQEAFGKGCEFVSFSDEAAKNFLGSSLCKIQRSLVSGSSTSVLGSRLEAYSIGTTLTGDQGSFIFSLRYVSLCLYIPFVQGF